MNHSHSNMVLLSSNFTVLIPYKTFGLCRLGDIIMSKKLLNKVISAILVLAVCSTAFLGCVVSAETYSGTYEIEGHNCADVGEEVRATITIKSDVAFVAGIFTVTADAPLDFEDINVDVIAGKDASGNNVDAPKIYINADKNKVLFQGWKDENLVLVEYSEITVQVKIKSTGIKVGTKYAINITDVDVTDKNENTYNITGSAGSVHVHTYERTSVAAMTTTYTCSVDGCGAVKTEVTDSKALEGVTVDTKFDAVNKMTVTFTASGDLVLNFLTNAALAAEGNTIYLAKKNSDGTIVLNSHAGKIEGFDAYQNVYVGGAKTIGDYIEAVFIEVTANGELVCKSNDIKESIANYCVTVIELNKNKTENKNENAMAYCKGLLSYGKEAASHFDYTSTALEAITSEDYISDYETITPALASDLVNNTNIANGWSFASVNVRAITKPIVRLSFNIEEEALENLSLNISYNGITKTVSAKTFNQSGNGKYYIDINDIATKRMRDAITVENAANASQNCAYSVETYALNMANKNHDSAKLCRLLIAYSDALAAAFGS